MEARGLVSGRAAGAMEPPDGSVAVDARVLRMKRVSQDLLAMECDTILVANPHYIAVGKRVRVHASAPLPLDTIFEAWLTAEHDGSDGDGGSDGNGAAPNLAAVVDDRGMVGADSAAIAANGSAPDATAACLVAAASRQSVKGDRRRRARERAAARELRERTSTANGTGTRTMVRGAGTSVVRFRTRAGDVISEYNRKGEALIQMGAYIGVEPTRVHAKRLPTKGNDPVCSSKGFGVGAAEGELVSVWIGLLSRHPPAHAALSESPNVLTPPSSTKPWSGSGWSGWSGWPGWRVRRCVNVGATFSGECQGATPRDIRAVVGRHLRHCLPLDGFGRARCRRW